MVFYCVHGAAVFVTSLRRSVTLLLFVLLVFQACARMQFVPGSAGIVTRSLCSVTLLLFLFLVFQACARRQFKTLGPEMIVTLSGLPGSFLRYIFLFIPKEYHNFAFCILNFAFLPFPSLLEEFYEASHF